MKHLRLPSAILACVITLSACTVPHEVITPSPATVTVAASPATPAPTPLPAANPLVNELRKGGYIIYFRHGQTDHSQKDLSLSQCDTQRNLDAQGRADSVTIGQGIRALGIPLNRVVVSPYCRTKETAELMLGNANYETLEHYDVVVAFTQESLTKPPKAGVNTVIVAHGMVISQVAKLKDIAEGEAAVYKPDDKGNVNLLARILPNEWATFGEAPKTPLKVQEYAVPAGSSPHDVAPAIDGGIWFTAQGNGSLGHLNPRTGVTKLIKLGPSSSPHGVVVGPDGAPWVTDSGQNAIIRVNPFDGKVTTYPLPAEAVNANLNTGTFDRFGKFWFTGQNGFLGKLDIASGKIEVWKSPRGSGPYGIDATAGGDIYYASLAGNHIGRIDPSNGAVSVIEPPTPQQGARRVWGDSKGRLWVSEWNSGQLSMFDPIKNGWQQWKLPGSNPPQAYAVYVDDRDTIWVSDFGNNSIVNFDFSTQKFTSYPLPSPKGSVRQILGRPGEIWAAESAVNKLIVIRTRQ